LVDSPIEIGNHEILEFEALGIPHQIAMYSNVKLEYDKNKLLNEYKAVVEKSASVVGEHPCKNYLFIVHHLPGIGGGLEHLNSTTCQTSPTAYLTEKSNSGFFTLIAHEYFHLWNVKRIRPIALGPFDYENENYTNMLWVAEGFTSFYEDDIVRRANIVSVKDYLETVINGINGIENTPGNKIQSAAESSWDAWIKFYRPNENSSNSTISYYSKGGVIGAMLNLIILKETKTKKSLDDVMKLLWDENFKKLKRGYTDEEFKLACEKVAGISLKDFFEKYIYGTETIPYQKYFDYAGLDFVDSRLNDEKSSLGAIIRNKKITSVQKNSSAEISGLNVNDEIVSIDGLSLEDYDSLLASKLIGQKITVKVLRSGQKLDIDCVLLRNTSVRYVLKQQQNVSADQSLVYKKFVHEN
jgi:predicted metalloprotease with PDZ domain